MAVGKENITAITQKEAGGKAQAGVYVFWGLAAVQFVLGIFTLRIFLSSFYPLFAAIQLTGLFDFSEANLYGFFLEKVNVAYLKENYVGMIITIVAGLLLTMMLGAFAGMNSKVAANETRSLALQLAKSYLKVASVSGVISLLFLLLARMAA